MITFNWLAVFSLLIVGAVYFLCEDFQELFNPVSVAAEDVNFTSDESTEGYVSRKLLALERNLNDNSLEPDLISFSKEKLNSVEKIKEVSKSFVSYDKLRRNRMKKLSRRKRDAHRNDFGWKLSLNVTNKKNPPKAISNLASENDLLSKSGKGKFLNMAVQMEGASPDNSFHELHHSWDSLGLLLRRLYRKNSSFKENARDNTAEISTEPNDIVSSDIPTEKPERGRTPKLIFGLFNFGSSENPEGVGTTAGNRDFSESVTSPRMNVTLKEEHISTKDPLSTNTTEASVDFGLPNTISVDSTEASITETFTSFESTSSEFNTQFVEKFGKASVSPDIDFPIEITTIKPENSFSPEQLKEFCVGLLSRIKVSARSADHFSEEDGSGELDKISMEDKEAVTGFPSLTTDIPKEEVTKSNNQVFGIWASIWNRFAGRRLIQHPLDVGLQSSTVTVKHDIALKKAKDSANETFSLKDESSTIQSISDFTESEGFFSDEDESALTVPDCENFFRQMQNDAVFSKPNLLDVLNNPILLSLKPSQFNFTEIHDDKQMQSLKPGSDATESKSESNFLSTEEMVNSISTFSSARTTIKEHSDEFSVNHLLNEQPDKNLFENTVSNQDIVSLPSSTDAQESFQNGKFDKPNGSLIAENEEDLATEITADKFITMQIQSTTGLLDDGSFDLSDVHARTDKSLEIPSSEVSADIDDRIFGLLNLGSGERSLEDSDFSTGNVSEFPENQSFHPDLINFENGDSELNETFSVNGLEITSTDFATRPTILDVIPSLGREGSRMKSTETNSFDITEGDQPTEGANTILSIERQRIKLQFNPEEKPIENQDILDLTNMPPTQSISDEQTTFQNVFNEKPRIEFQLNPEENITENQNVLDSTHMPATQSLSEDQTPSQIILDRNDEGSRIFPGLVNFLGSGDGRELSEIPTDTEINSEFSDCLGCFKNKSGSFLIDDCINCESDVNDTVPLIGEQILTTINSLSNKIVSDDSVDEIDLDNKAFTSFESNKNLLEFSTVRSDHRDNSESADYEEYEQHDNSENSDYKIISLQPLDVHIEAKYNESHSDINTEAFSASPTGAITVHEDLRFMDTIFLTGSGAGGLFGNDNSEINLVQEPDTTSFSFPLLPVSPRQSRRGGRMDDVPFANTWPTEKKEHASIDITQPQNRFDSTKLNSHDTSKDAKVFQTREEVNEFNTDTISLLTTSRSIQRTEDRFSNPKFKEYTTQPFQDLSSETFTAISIPTSSFVIPKRKAKDLPPKYCNRAGECNIALNEGCITKEGRGVCDCRRSFVRDPETEICEAPFMRKTSLKLPGEVFHQDLGDKSSELYQNKTKDAIDTMWMVVYQDPTLEYNIANISVTGFEEGSLVIHWEFIFAVKKNENITEIVREVDEKLQETFKREAILNSAPLNVENAKWLSAFSDVNPCENKELNYCSKDADCTRDEYRGFRCRCKEGYFDNSKHPMYPGEICISTCPPDFCGENGYCEVRPNGEKQCLCNGWYFGGKCSVSGILLISCFAGGNAILIVVVLATVYFCKRRRQRRTRFYENNQIMFQPNRELGPLGRVSPRLAASIALDELGSAKTSKYMAISTPLYMKPDIQITSPSIIGSSISYDYDSTFDRTPSAELKMEPPKYDSVPEVPKYDSVPEV